MIVEMFEQSPETASQWIESILKDLYLLQADDDRINNSYNEDTKRRKM